METFRPTSEDELAELVRDCAAASRRLRIAGHGTKAGMGAPVAADAALDTTALAGVEDYQPEELTFTALAGTPLADITAMLSDKRQMLPFEPPEFAPVLAAFGAQDATEAGATLGGLAAVGMAGPRQVLRWSVRDHLLGFSAVNGHGELFKAGGRVVKNVTGYDLPKLMCGSFGTLSVLARLTFRVLPAPERAMTLVHTGMGAKRAVSAFARAMRTPAEVSAACWLPAALAAGAPLAAGDAPLAALRLEGYAESLPSRAQMLRKDLAEFGDWQPVEGAAWEDFWSWTRDVRWLMPNAAGRWLWRLVTAPAAGGALAEAIISRHPLAELFIDRAGGLVWLSLPRPEPDVAARAAEGLRRLAAEYGARAMLFAAPEDCRRIVRVFPPLPQTLTALSERVRTQFDPAGVLNPGIMDNLSSAGA